MPPPPPDMFKSVYLGTPPQPHPTSSSCRQVGGWQMHSGIIVISTILHKIMSTVTRNKTVPYRKHLKIEQVGFF